jgi:GNAT superfamily N-acetyltransferase
VPRKRPTYSQTALLCALVLGGWAYDAALGGGRPHEWAWLVALVLVGGISALTVRSAQRYLPQAGAAEPDVEPELDLAIRPAAPDELAELPDIERAADRLFDLAGYGTMPRPATVDELQAAALLLVAGLPAIGYLRVDVIDGEPHIEQVSVRPKHMRQGIGTALVEAACSWAKDGGYNVITLCTFADVPWNAPFYARLGFFEVTELAPGLRERRQDEAPDGLHRVGRRIVMRRPL